MRARGGTVLSRSASGVQRASRVGVGLQRESTTRRSFEADTTIYDDQGAVMARYGKKAQSKVTRAMHERKLGTPRSGSSGKRVTSRKQAIAIGLSEARRAGGKVPKPGGRRRMRAKKK